VSALGECDVETQQRMIAHLHQCDTEYGQRVADGLAVASPEASTRAMTAEFAGEGR
jgi:catalase